MASQRREIWGLWFDPETLHFYSEPYGGLEYTYTFENAQVNGWASNPINHATAETAERMKTFIQSLIPWAEINVVTGDFIGARTPERRLRISNGISSVDLNAGLIANALIRSGEYWTQQMVKGNLQNAGILI